jgi:hypothetical protein
LDVEACAHSVTSFILFALLGTIGRVFKCRCVAALGQKMSDSKNEQRVNVKFLVILKKSSTENFQSVTEAYGEVCVSGPGDFEGR